jgi:membrane-associated phospholipid phosphatase
VTALCYGLATTIAMERVDSKNHWPSDVFLAAVSGTTIARTVVRRNEERRSERRSAVIVPGALLADGSPGVFFAFRF